MKMLECSKCSYWQEDCSCGMCHSCGAPLFPLFPLSTDIETPQLVVPIVPPGILEPMTKKVIPDSTQNVGQFLMPLPKTQKAKGIHALSQMAISLFNHHVSVFSVTARLQAPDWKKQVETFNDYYGFSTVKFARPCPLVPRHGFVDSRPVASKKELIAVCEETFKVEPDGEVIVGAFLKSSHNAVWTPDLLTVGLGHDGATAGKNTVVFPLSGLNPLKGKSGIGDAALGPKAHPYIEVVYPLGAGPVATQLRGGPPLEKGITADYIPADMTIKAVIKTQSETLLEWEEKLSKLAPKTAVYHPGGSPTDHWYVHARLNKIPVIISYQPKVGEKLVKNVGQEIPFDPKAVLRGIKVAEKISLKNRMDVGTNLSLLALHNAPQLVGPNSYWIGVGACLLLRLGSSALRGEGRHAAVKTPGWASREKVYQMACDRRLSYHRASLNRFVGLFRYGGWSPSYGGPKWAACGASLKPVFEAIRTLAKDPNEQTVTELVKAYNVAINQAHNGGWWLNKFTNIQAADQIPKGSLSYTLPLARLIYEIGDAYREAETISYTDIANWPETLLAPPKFSKPVLRVFPGASQAKLVMSSRMLGSKNKPEWTIPVSEILATVLNAKAGTDPMKGNELDLNIEMEGLDDGAIRLTKGGVPLWTSPALDLTGVNKNAD